MPDVIAVRNDLLPAMDRERNLAYDLNDEVWMDEIDAGRGAVFYASGVFYYFKTEDVKALFQKIPCVLATGNATSILKDGDSVIVDGTNGKVSIL